MPRARHHDEDDYETESGLAGRLRDVFLGFFFGREVDEDTSDRLQEILGFLLIGVSVFLFISLVSYYTPYDDPGARGRNWCGRAGFYLANMVYVMVGWSGHLLVVLMAAWGVVILARKQVQFASLRILGAICLLSSVAFLMELGFGTAAHEGPQVVLAGAHEVFPGSLDGTQAVPNFGTVQPDPFTVGSRLPYGPGGFLAMQSSPFLVDKFGEFGLWLLLSLLALVSFMLATEMAFVPSLQALVEWLRERREERDEGSFKLILGWLKGVVHGLWDFLRGVDLRGTVMAAGGAGLLTAPRGGTKKAAPAKKKAKKKSKKDELEPELFEEDLAEDEEWEEEEEWEEDEPEGEDEEWEYEDEEDDEYEYEDEEYEEEDEEEPEVVIPVAKAKPKPKVERRVAKPLVFDPPTPPPGEWKFPPISLLEKPEAGSDVDDKRLEQAASTLENALKSFRVDAEVVAAQVGPAVTLFELTVAQGTRMNKVTQLSQEIAAALRAKSVRIIAPIPGKATIGIEVPNAKRRTVRLAEIIHAKAYDKKFAALPLFLGMDAEGLAIVEDLARMPHLLIAGTTGSGKSVCINTIIASLLLTRSPHDVQMILVDPKMVELQMFAEVPHLMLPVVTDMRQATNVLLWACEKMDGRYELLKDAGVKHIKGFNALGEEKLRERFGDAFNEERTPRHLPYIVVVIDEMADLMMMSKKEAEQSITRLAQKSRAVGIHVIVATQRPSTDVITGVLKGNLPSRMAFQVASKIDSRVILDDSGAEKLLGGGDMLYTPPQSSQIRRVQGALVEDHELQAIVDFVCKESAPTFSQELIQAATGTGQPGQGTGGGMDVDPLFNDAVGIVLKSQRGSASLLQRALAVGYTRASRLIDLMTEAGIVGAHKGSKAREILMTLEDWEEGQGIDSSEDSL